MSKQLTMTDGFGKVRKIGLLNGETLRLWRDRDKHLFRKKNAWCIDKDAFLYYDNVRIYIVEEKSGEMYLATRDTIKEHGIDIQFPGHGEQIAIPIKHWKIFPKLEKEG